MVLACIMAALLAVHIVLQVWHYQWHKLPWLLRQIFDVNEEDALPTWYSSSLLLLASALLYIVSRRKRADGDPWMLYWYGLSLGFAFLSIDEVAGFHETLNSLIEVSWTIPGGVVAAFVGLLYLKFLLHLPARTRWLFIVSGCVFLGGALGVERWTDWYAEEDLRDTLAYNLWNAAEEGSEMGGVVLFIHALVGYMGRGEDVHVDVTVAGRDG